MALRFATALQDAGAPFERTAGCGSWQIVKCFPKEIYGRYHAFEMNWVSIQVAPKRWPAEVGPMAGETFCKCGIGYAAIFHSRTRTISLFPPSEAKALGKALREADKVVGFNCLYFDVHLLSGAGLQISSVRWLDLMQEVECQTLNRFSLDQIMAQIEPRAGGTHWTKYRRWIKERDEPRLAEKCANDAMRIARLLEQLCAGCQLRLPASSKCASGRLKVHLKI